MAANQQQQGLVTIGLLIPGESIARVIGKAGVGLKQIRESTGCKLQVSEFTGDHTLARRVSITGFPQAVGVAVQQALTKAFSEDRHQTTVTEGVTVFIPSELAGVVVGKAGANLKKVREFLAVRLELERDSFTDPMFGPQRKVTMSGSWVSMGLALAMALGGAGPHVQLHHSGVTSMLGIPTPQHGHDHASAFLAVAPGRSMSNVDVRPVSGDPEEIQLHMVVPDKIVGALLGKEGSQIKQVGAMSGCRLCMSKKDLGERRVVIIGTYSQCVTAQRALQMQLLAAAEQAGLEAVSTTITFFIRSAVAGAVIGKGGATLKLIREQTGTKVQVGRDEVQGQRPCTISGANEQVMQAVGMIHDLLNEEGEGQADSPTGEHSPAKQSGPAAEIAAATSAGKGPGHDTKTTKLLVPTKSAGAVIGKQGCGLARIRELCGVKVDMLQQVQAQQWPEDRVVILQGLLENRESAAANVLQAAFHADASAADLKMLVPNSEAGAVIGKQGATLKIIREQCGINVHMEKNDVLGDRLVSAQGSLDSIVRVAHWVMWSIDGRDMESAAGPTL